MRNKTAFTLIELLVVVAIIVALLAILMPSMGEAIAVAQQTSCMASQRQVGVAAMSYASDNFGEYPYNNSQAPNTHTNRSGWVGWAEGRDKYVGYITDNNVFYCPAREDGLGTPTRSNQSTYLGASGKNSHAGWDALPLNVPANFYVWSDYNVFPNFHRRESGRRLNYMLGPNQLEEVSDPDATSLKMPRRAAELEGRSASDVPMVADWVYSRYVYSIIDSQSRGPEQFTGAWNHPAEYAGAHYSGTRWRGMGVTFIDGSTLWRGPDEAAPRINVNVGAQTSSYGYAYWY